MNKEQETEYNRVIDRLNSNKPLVRNPNVSDEEIKEGFSKIYNKINEHFAKGRLKE